MTTLSLCMIVRNEEQFLEQCLSSVQGLVDEIVIVDTGSTDKTKEIASRFTSKVFNFSWKEDFATARNESIQYATGDWVLILDADEVLAREDHAIIRKAIANASPLGSAAPATLAFRILTRNYSKDSSYSGWQPAMQEDTHRNSFLGWFPSVKVRLFRNLPEIRFEGKVHELVEPSLKARGLGIIDLPSVVHHYGALRNDKETKIRWHLTLLQQKVAATPPDAPAQAKVHYELGVIYKELGQFADAEKAFLRSLQLDPSPVEPLLCLAVVEQKQGRVDTAIRHFHQVLARKELAEGYFGLGYCLFLQGQLVESLAQFHAAIKSNPSFVEAYVNAGAVAEKMNKLPEAEGFLRKALSYAPSHARAQYNLGVVYEKAAQKKGAGEPAAWKQALECYKKALALGYPQRELLHERVEKIRGFLTDL